MKATRDDDVLEAVLAQELDDVLHARLADDRHHRLRLVRGERTQPRSLTSRHHNGPHRLSISRSARGAYASPAATARREARPEEPERPVGALVA